MVNTTPTPAVPVQVTRLQSKPMKANVLRFSIPFLVVAAVFFIYSSFGTQPKAMSAEEKCAEAQGDIEANSCLYEVLAEKRAKVTSEIEKLQTLQHAYDLQLRGLNTENNALRAKKE